MDFIYDKLIRKIKIILINNVIRIKNKVKNKIKKKNWKNKNIFLCVFYKKKTKNINICHK